MISPGFWIKENIFSIEECEEMIHVVRHKAGRSSRAGARNLMSIPEIRSLANDERLLRIGEEITGLRLIPYKATLFEKTGKANWLVAFHQDTALPVERQPVGDEWGASSSKAGILFSHAPTWALRKILALRIHLDASISSNGPLKVIPNSHARRLNDVEFEKVRASTPEVHCCVGKGGVIAMSPLLVHASSKSETDAPRRVLHIEYADSLDLDGVRLAFA